MDHQMLLLQARQDFLDLHRDLYHGESTTIDHYDKIVQEVKAMDDANFKLMLEFSEKTDQIPYERIYEQISAHIMHIKKEGNWRNKKEQQIGWTSEGVTVYAE